MPFLQAHICVWMPKIWALTITCDSPQNNMDTQSSPETWESSHVFGRPKFVVDNGRLWLYVGDYCGHVWTHWMPTNCVVEWMHIDAHLLLGCGHAKRALWAPNIMRNLGAHNAIRGHNTWAPTTYGHGHAKWVWPR